MAATRSTPRRGRLAVLLLLAALVLSAGTTLTYYVEALWFASLGYVDVFWKTLNLQSAVFIGTAAVTFAVLYGTFRALKPDTLGALNSGGHIIINGQPVTLPVEPVIRLIALAAAIFIAIVTAFGMMSEWATIALYWYGRNAAPSGAVDPIFGRPIAFYLFTLPALDLISGWLTTLSVMACGIAVFFVVVGGGLGALDRRRMNAADSTLRGLSVAVAALLFALAVRVFLGRFDRLVSDATIFAGVTYTDDHITLTGLLFVTAALAAGGFVALANAVVGPRVRWMVASVLPAFACYILVSLVGWYVNSFIVKPNELVRERPYISHNIELTRQAYGLDRITVRPFPAETGLEAIDAPGNRATLENLRLWDWRALQDTLRQIQEIRTYYDFPDIDIDRYELGGTLRQVMLGTRELSIDKLPQSSRNWINEKLIYTHGYGVTMNPANGFTPEGLPTFLLSNMPVQSTPPAPTVNRPEIYFGELTNNDVYVNTRQKEFNYPQGDTNSLTSYEGTGGIAVGGFLRRLLIALERGDIAKLPFSDDVNADSRLLMRRSIRERVTTLAPFLVFDPDPYIVIGDDGRLWWMMDAFTTSDNYPYSRHYRLGRTEVNYIRNSVKAVVNAYDGSTSFYVFDTEDPVIAAYRAIFPTLFKDASAMPADLRRHVRYPELLLELQAAVYGLYHMTDPDVFYNREDLWTVASEVRGNNRDQAAQPVEPNFVLMTLPGESGVEFVEILPFTPANRNNLIGWIAGRSDGEHYGKLVAYNFPKNKLVDGPLQVEARIDQNSQLSGQFSLWNQQGSHVRARRAARHSRRQGTALRRADLPAGGAQPDARTAPGRAGAAGSARATAPTFEAAMAALFGQALPSSRTGGDAAVGAARQNAAPAQPAADLTSLIRDAARDLAEYQRLTAEGKLGEAGQRLESLKRKLDELQRERR